MRLPVISISGGFCVLFCNWFDFILCGSGLCFVWKRKIERTRIFVGARFISVFYHQVETVDWVMHKNRTSLFSLRDVPYRIEQSIKIHTTTTSVCMRVYVRKWPAKGNAHAYKYMHRRPAAAAAVLLSLCQPDFLSESFTENWSKSGKNRSMLTTDIPTSVHQSITHAHRYKHTCAHTRAHTHARTHIAYSFRARRTQTCIRFVY